MKTIISGSRSFEDYSLLLDAIGSAPFEITHVIQGGAKGVDCLANRWAEEQRIPVTEFKADWKRFGKAAGPIRNREMAANAEALIAIWDGVSRGTKNMIDLATEGGLTVFVYAQPTFEK